MALGGSGAEGSVEGVVAVTRGSLLLGRRRRGWTIVCVRSRITHGGKGAGMERMMELTLVEVVRSNAKEMWATWTPCVLVRVSRDW